MKIKTNLVLKKILTKDSVENEDKKPLKLGEFICNVLSMSPTEDPHKSYSLAKKFGTQDEVTVTIDEVKHIKDVLLKSKIAPITAGQAIDMLEGNEEPLEDKKGKK